MSGAPGRKFTRQSLFLQQSKGPSLRTAIAVAAGLTIAGCVASSEEHWSEPENIAVIQPIESAAKPAPALENAPAAPVRPAGPTTFTFSGEITQGGWIRGQAPAGSIAVKLDDKTLKLDDQGRFFAAFDRDSPPSAALFATLSDGKRVESPIKVSPREWNIERVNVARSPGGPSEAFMRIRRPELEQIGAARAIDSGSTGWQQDFIWPVTGRISGLFGSQRIYRGEPGSYHSGIDIARESGTPFVAPADGVVVLATKEPFSLEGYLLIVDHGMGLNSAFLHCSAIDVVEGEKVRQGQQIGRIGATGRATGPHLHWGLVWQGSRLDPLLFTGPMN